MKHSDPERQHFIHTTHAPREALEKFDLYAGLLTEWNEKFNLVAPSTIPHIWSRHFLDSAQLVPVIKASGISGVLTDLGSGAGFPGIVLGIFGIPNIHLVESTRKKADFLRLVAEKLGLPITVHNARIEGLKGHKSDLITARALASLMDLLKLAHPLLKKESVCFFMKGQNVVQELTDAQKCWMYDVTQTPSLSDPSGSILAIRNLRKNDKRPHRRP